MITQILKEMEISSKPVTLKYLSYKIGLDESALEGIMGFLERKGIVRDSSCCIDDFRNFNSLPHCQGCAISNCPLAKNLPKTYTLNTIQKSQIIK